MFASMLAVACVGLHLLPIQTAKKYTVEMRMYTGDPLEPVESMKCSWKTVEAEKSGELKIGDVFQAAVTVSTSHKQQVVCVLANFPFIRVFKLPPAAKVSVDLKIDGKKYVIVKEAAPLGRDLPTRLTAKAVDNQQWVVIRVTEVNVEKK